MSELQVQTQGLLDNASPYDVIQLPNETLDFPLIISKPCTVLGRDNTVVDVRSGDYSRAVEIIADGVTLSDVGIRNKSETGYNAVYVKGNQLSLERLDVACDVGIVIDSSEEVDLIEIRAHDASTGFKVINSQQVEINACAAYNNSIGLDIIGDSSVVGSVDSYQSFGLNIQPADVTSLTDAEYEFTVDGMIFSFTANSGMTYQELVNSINSIVGFNPTYKAEILNNDIVIKTQNDTISIETASSSNSLLTTLSTTPKPPVNSNEYSYATFGLNINETDVSPLDRNVLFTFFVDGKELQFYSPETDGTTYRELVDLIAGLLDPGYEIDIVDNDIRITNSAASVVLTKGERFKDLFAELGITTIPTSVHVIESYQELGLSVLETDTTPLSIGTYGIIISGVEYEFEITSGSTTYNQLIALMNGNSEFANNYEASFVGGDIRITTNDPAILVNDKKLNLFSSLGVVLSEAVDGSVDSRKDRSQDINIISSLFHENGIGVRVMNGNDIIFTDCKIFSNTNIGIWQMPSSYNVKFRGEIYGNKNYGARNTDKASGDHQLDIMQSWWGDITGPSMFGPGEGDKISNNVLWQPQRQSGTILDLSYPKTRQFILSALGYPVVKVELTDEQIYECIDKAISKYMQYRTPEPIQRYIPLGAGSDIYRLPLDIPKEEIIEVTYSPNADIFAQLSGSGESFLMTYYMNGSSGTFLSDFFVAMAYRETMETTLGIMPTYELLSVKNDDGTYSDAIRLAPRPDGNVSLGLLVSRPLTEEEADSVDWIHKYALAWAKSILSQIRGKYGSVPGPTGEMSLNAASLEAQAQQEIEKLEESIVLRGEPLGFVTG